MLNASNVATPSTKGSPMYDANIGRYYAIAIAIERTQGRNWYPTMAARLQELASLSRLTIAQVADIFAACSVNTEWRDNVKRAERYIADFTNGILPTRGHLRPVVANLRAIILTGATIDALIKDRSALKIRSFAYNLRDDASYVTVDRWAYRIAVDFADCPNASNRDARGIPFACAKNGRHECGKVPKGKEYREIEAAYVRVAAKYNERPHDLQAITWVVVTGTSA